MLRDVQNDTSILSQLFDTSAEAVLWFVPASGMNVDQSDYVVSYCNDVAVQLLDASASGSCTLTSLITDHALRETLFVSFNNVMSSEQTADFVAGPFQFKLRRVTDGVFCQIKPNHDQLLESILEASFNGVLAANAILADGKVHDLQIVQCNQTLRNILRINDSAAEGRRCSEIIPSLLTDEVKAIIFRVLETGKQAQTEIHITLNNAPMHYLISVSKWRDSGIVMTILDYTPVRQLQQELSLTLQALGQSNERLSEFIYVASHDLHDPLRKVSAFARLLSQKLGEHQDETVNDYLARLERSVERMQKMLESLLIYSRTSKEVTGFKRVPLIQAVDAALADLKSSITNTKAIIRADELPVITGDLAQLKNIFSNLVANAILFQPKENTPYIHISYRGANARSLADEAKSYHLIEVSDNGIGFDPTEADRIFKLFYKIHSRFEYEGAGIGLAIVQKGMENHHGFVEAKSEPGKGATFRLYFPT